MIPMNIAVRNGATAYYFEVSSSANGAVVMRTPQDYPSRAKAIAAIDRLWPDRKTSGQFARQP